MRAVRYHENGGPDVLQLEEIDRPNVGKNELLVQVEAAGINPVDVKFREGTYPTATFPMIPGSDFAGTVAAVGSQVGDFEEGDRVYGTGLGADRLGTCAEYATVPLDRVAHFPDSVSFEEGAAMALVGVTAFEGMITTGGLTAGDVCLVHGGSGGVGHVAVQIAAAAGASVITTAAPEYHDRLRDLGADAVFDYDRDDLAEAISEVGAPDVILDHLLSDYLGLDTEVGAQDAHVVAIASADNEACFPNVGMARGKQHSLTNFSMLNVPDLSPALENLAAMMDAGRITALVEDTYDLGAVGDAHQDVLEESFLGKLVVVP